MTDLLQRLRVMARLTNREDDADTAAEAAREIARLRLTDEEREAASDICEFAEDFLGEDDPNIATLRGLLERTK